MTDNEHTAKTRMKSAIIFGWDGVEHLAAQWAKGATVEEVEPRLWIVRDPSGATLGVIAKNPWSAEEVERRAQLLQDAAAADAASNKEKR